MDNKSLWVSLLSSGNLRWRNEKEKVKQKSLYFIYWSRAIFDDHSYHTKTNELEFMRKDSSFQKRVHAYRFCFLASWCALVSIVSSANLWDSKNSKRKSIDVKAAQSCSFVNVLAQLCSLCISHTTIKLMRLLQSSCQASQLKEPKQTSEVYENLKTV